MKRQLKIALAVSTLIVATHAAAQITFYEGEGFRGRAFTTSQQVPNFDRTGFNDRTSSIVIERGRWEVCEHANFRGRCVVLRRGSYDTLAASGPGNSISSVRPADNRRRYDNEVSAPLETPNYAWRRRANERVFEAPVTSVHAVMGAPTERCWVERQQVNDNRGDRNVGGAIAGALIGGVLGHQVGGGTRQGPRHRGRRGRRRRDRLQRGTRRIGAAAVTCAGARTPPAGRRPIGTCPTTSAARSIRCR